MPSFSWEKLAPSFAGRGFESLKTDIDRIPQYIHQIRGM
jgi:hypothetical protein